MINIPNNLKKIIQDNYITALAMLDNIYPQNPPKLSLDDCQEFYESKLFVDKLKLECWEFCSQIWKEVWQEYLKNIPTLNETNINYIKSPYDAFRFCNDVKFTEKNESLNASIFTIRYYFNKRKNIHFSIKIDWKQKKIGSYCSFENKDGHESAVIPNNTELNSVIQDIDNDISNQSTYQISLMKEKINENEINELKKAAMEIVDYINKKYLITQHK